MVPDTHTLVREKEERARRASRSAQPLWARLGVALTAAQHLAGGRAASLGRETARAQPGSSPPPPENSLYDHYERRFRLMVEALEREVDAEKYRPASADMARESTKERDLRLIRDFEGIHSLEVSFIDRSFGSQRSVERARVKCSRRPVDGAPMQQVWQD